jgi:TolB protein
MEEMKIAFGRLFMLPSCIVALALTGSSVAKTQTLGIFEGHQDVGTVLHAGSAAYDPTNQSYTIAGSGENMWFGEDDFHFVWTKVSGDVSITADIAFLGTAGNNHRKAVLMIRQSLDGNSKAVDIARHGDGLTSLQYRDETGGNTHEVESNVSAPHTVRLEKRGDYFYAFISGKDGKLQPTGASTKLELTGPFYIGIGVSAHDKDVVEHATFSNVKLHKLTQTIESMTLFSTLETVTIASTDRHVEYVAPAHFEAPNWSKDGSYFLYNRDGKIFRLNLHENEPTLIATAPQDSCNNDHGLSPDGKLIAISDQSEGKQSHIYIAPIGGGSPRRITSNGPSYWHGWSPDGKTLAFTGQRGGEFDIYSIPVAGGTETRLTSAPGLDDGSEYSPDGAYLYFNSERTGSMQIWRMRADGSNQEQVISDSTNDWFPHISPNGKWMVFLAYEKTVSGHPPNKDVALYLMSIADKKVHLLAKLFGGQGTINVPSWSPDSSKLAFVSYEFLPKSADPSE